MTPKDLPAAAWSAAAPSVQALVSRASHVRHRAVPALQHAGRRVRETDQRVLAGGVALLVSAAVIGTVVAARASRKKQAAASDEHHAKDGDKFIERSVTVNKPRDELYRRWRDFANLPSFMETVESVTDAGDGRSHWVVRGPGDKRLEYDTVITEDRPGEVIAWESTPGADVRNESRIEFKDAPGGRGTEIHAKIDYHPPAGPLGKIVAVVTQKGPELQVRRDLRRFKQLMETGEIATTEGPGAAPSSKYNKKH